MRNFLENKTSHIAKTVMSVGAFLGAVILFSCVQFYFDIQDLLTKQTDSLSGDYLVIQKPVSALNAVGVSNSEFLPDEIEEIKKQEFTVDLAPFIGSNFEASIEYKASKNIPGFYTLIFFEALPDRFIDINTENWEWDNQEDVVPVIIPQNFIDLFNFGIGEMQGLPKIYDGLLSNLRFTIYCKGNGKTLSFQGRFEGFSDRINTVLVPNSFINYCNNQLSINNAINPTRIILKTNDNKNPKVRNFIDENKYQVNKEELKGSMQSTVTRIILSLVLVIGLIINVLSMINFIQSAQIIVAKSKENIKKLILIGVNYKDIANEVFKGSFSRILTINILALIITFSLSYFFQFYLKANFEIESNFKFRIATISFFIVLNVVMFLILKRTMNKMVRNEIS